MISDRVRNARFADEAERVAKRERQRSFVELLERMVFDRDGGVRDDLDPALLELIDAHWQAKRELLTLETAHRHALNAEGGGNGGVTLTPESEALIPQVEAARRRVNELQIKFQTMLEQVGGQS
ncbi:hypothetical protein PQQ75_04175 [Paraburkholderia aspalathi]|uniref:hypothetical protein n=1 Tax=Paraburkholderia aspalathi TaxID=1324617 RepID=UPI0038B8E954